MITGNDKNLYLSSTVLSSSDFSIRTIVKGHPLNTFDVLFFDSIITKLARSDRHRVHIAVSTQNCGIKRSKEQTLNTSCYFYRLRCVFIFRPRFANFISYSRIFLNVRLDVPLAATTFPRSFPRLSLRSVN